MVGALTDMQAKHSHINFFKKTFKYYFRIYNFSAVKITKNLKLNYMFKNDQYNKFVYFDSNSLKILF